VALDGRAALLDLMVPIALDERDLQPLAWSARAGEQDLVRRLASEMQ